MHYTRRIWIQALALGYILSYRKVSFLIIQIALPQLNGRLQSGPYGLSRRWQRGQHALVPELHHHHRFLPTG